MRCGHRPARRGRRRLARGLRQRRARRAWARRSSTTPSTTIRGLYDLADMARAKHDRATYAWARRSARDLLHSGSRTRGGIRVADGPQYADSLDDPRRRDSIPAEALDRRDADGGRADDRRQARARAGDLDARRRRARRSRDAVLLRRAAVQPRPVPHRLRRRPDGRGRADDLRAQHGDPGRRRGQLRPARRRSSRSATPTPRSSRCSASRTRPTARPTSSPERCRRSSRRRTSTPPGRATRTWTAAGRCRSMVMQAWGHYGTMWPVVHQQLGVRPDLGRDRLRSCRSCRRRPRSPVGTSGSAAAGSTWSRASRDGSRYTTKVDTGDAPVGGCDRPHAAARRERRRGEARRPPGRLARAHAPTAALEVTVGTGRGEHTLVVGAR